MTSHCSALFREFCSWFCFTVAFRSAQRNAASQLPADQAHKQRTQGPIVNAAMVFRMAKNSVLQSHRIHFAGPSFQPLLFHFFQLLPSGLGRVGAVYSPQLASAVVSGAGTAGPGPGWVMMEGALSGGVTPHPKESGIPRLSCQNGLPWWLSR